MGGALRQGEPASSSNKLLDQRARADGDGAIHLHSTPRMWTYTRYGTATERSPLGPRKRGCYTATRSTTTRRSPRFRSCCSTGRRTQACRSASTRSTLRCTLPRACLRSRCRLTTQPRCSPPSHACRGAPPGPCGTEAPTPRSAAGPGSACLITTCEFVVLAL